MAQDQAFEVEVSSEYLERIESDLESRTTSDTFASEGFTAYNRGGGPAGQYDRHYDKSTGD